MSDQEPGFPESPDPEEAPEAPTTDYAFSDGMPPQATKWPKVIGILSIVVAAVGMTCQGTGVLGLLLAPLMRRIAGFDMQAPLSIQVLAYASFAIYICLGILLLVGGVRVLRRRPRGVANLKTWAVLRLGMVIISFTAGFMTLPANVEMQRTLNDSVNEMRRKRNQPEKPFDDDAIYRWSAIMAVVGAGTTAIFPIFLGFFLSRKSIDEELETWGMVEEVL